jgi:hypothetical protein
VGSSGPRTVPTWPFWRFHVPRILNRSIRPCGERVKLKSQNLAKISPRCLYLVVPFPEWLLLLLLLFFAFAPSNSLPPIYYAVRLSLAPSSFSFFHSLPVDGPRENTAAAEDSCTLARKNSHGRVKRREGQHRFAKRLGTTRRGFRARDSGLGLAQHARIFSKRLSLRQAQHPHPSASNARRLLADSRTAASMRTGSVSTTRSLRSGTACSG